MKIERKTNRFHILKLTICVVFLLSVCLGCTKYTFEDTDIEAYVNDIAVSETQEAQFIEFSKLYWPLVAASCDEVINKPDEEYMDEFAEDYGDENEEYIAEYASEKDVWLIKFLAGVIKSDAEKKAAYTDEEWKKEYYRLIIVKNHLYSVNKQFQTAMENMVEQNMMEISDTGDFTYMNGKIHIIDTIETLANNYQMAMEEYTEQVLTPSFELMGADEYYRMYYGSNLYNGGAVELEAYNEEQYAAYYVDMVEQYAAYTEKLLEKANIVERQ